MMNHLRELWCGVISGVLGLVLLAVVTFAPLVSYARPDSGSDLSGFGQSNPTGDWLPLKYIVWKDSLWSHASRGEKLYLAVDAIAFTAILVGTLLHALWEIPVGRWLQRTAVVVTLVGSLVCASLVGPSDYVDVWLSINVNILNYFRLFPAALLGLIAALGGPDDAQDPKRTALSTRRDTRRTGHTHPRR